MAYRQQEGRRLSKHHRLPKSRGGSNTPKNISVVDADQHAAFHKIFRNGTAQEVADILNDTWIDPDKVLICVDRIDADVTQMLLKQLARLGRR